MSLLSGIFTLPFGTALQAYKQVNWENPLTLNSERIFKSDERYAEVLGILSKSPIKTAMQPFLDRTGMRKDLMFIESTNIGFCASAGTSMFKKADAAVLVAPRFYDVDKDACTWVVKHEIGHIKHNDNFIIPVVAGICQLVASIFGMCALPFFPALGLAWTVGMVAYGLFSRWREARADDFAIENSSDEELKGGRRFLMAMQKLNYDDRKTWWKRVENSASGDQRIDILHPSLTSRIQKIEKALRARNVELDSEAERQKLEGGLQTYVDGEKRNIDKAVAEMGGFFGLMKQMFSF